MTELALLGLAWLLTYLVHSTLVLGGTWAVTEFLQVNSLRWRDRLWKLALVGGLVTASLQVGMGLEPFGGSWALREDPPPALEAPAESPEEPTEEATDAPADAPSGPESQARPARGDRGTPSLLPVRFDPRLVEGNDARRPRGVARPAALLRPAEDDPVQDDPVQDDPLRNTRHVIDAVDAAPLPTGTERRRTRDARDDADPSGSPVAQVTRRSPNADGAAPGHGARGPGERTTPAGGNDVAGLFAPPPATAAPTSEAPQGRASQDTHAPGADLDAPLAATVSRLPWREGLLGVWLLAAAAAVFVFAASFRRLRLHLAGREELRDGPLRRTLDVLCERAGLRAHVRLTASDRLMAPITLGILRREICVPVRVLTDLDPAQQEAMLGHELGHAIRRDPAWLGLCWILETLLFFQPLNRLGRRRMQQAAEYLCDDWAVRLTGRSLSLASCLTEVAQWVVSQRRALPVPAMAATGSALGLRVGRLLEGTPPTAERRQPWWAPTAAGLLVALAFAVPGFSGTRVPAPLLGAAAAPGPAPVVPAPTPLSAGGGPDATVAVAPVNAATGLQAALLADFDGLETELSRAESELRALKRELADVGGLDDVAEALVDIEQRVAALRSRRDRLRSLLPRVLPLLEDLGGTAAASHPPSPDSHPRAASTPDGPRAQRTGARAPQPGVHSR